MTQIITILNIFIYSNSQDNNFFFYIEHRLKTIYVILKKENHIIQDFPYYRITNTAYDR
jgi:hypothetical protein